MASGRSPATTLFIFVMILFITGVSGCNLEQFISGIVTLSDMSVGNYIIVILDDDRDPTDGYLSNTTVEITVGGAVPVAYVLDTTGISDGTYFLVAGYNADSSETDPASWTGLGWYGADPPSEPNEANVSDMKGRYNIDMVRPVS